VTVLNLSPTPPNRNAPPLLTLAPDKTEDKLTLTLRPDLLPGTYSIVLQGLAAMQFNKDPKAPQKQPISIVASSLPITLTVLPKEKGK
jgi:hypothetical protein